MLGNITSELSLPSKPATICTQGFQIDLSNTRLLLLWLPYLHKPKIWEWHRSTGTGPFCVLHMLLYFLTNISACKKATLWHYENGSQRVS